MDKAGLYEATTQAERTLLANVLIYPEELAQARNLVSPDDFLIEQHKRIWEAMLNSPLPNVVGTAFELALRKTLASKDNAYLCMLFADEELQIATIEDDISFNANVVSDYSKLRANKPPKYKDISA